jgi:hypothetical protein
MLLLSRRRWSDVVKRNEYVAGLDVQVHQLLTVDVLQALDTTHQFKVKVGNKNHMQDYLD